MSGDHRRSYLKTTVLAGIGGLVILTVPAVVAPIRGIAHVVILAATWLAAAPPITIAVGGLVVLYRDRAQAAGHRDPFLAANDTRAERAIGEGHVDLGLRLRRAVRAVVAPRRLIVGDEIEVRSLDEIRATLDEHGALERLPFMPEMVAFCGQRARVFRRVDKIYDYGGAKTLRHLRGTVLLTGRRCNGGAHDECQAGCYVMWKEAWLRRSGDTRPAPVRSVLGQPAASKVTRADGTMAYNCQFTSLVAASSPMGSPLDPRPDLRPLFAGNLTLRAFTVALLTRVFNAVQMWRGGIVFPAMGHGTSGKSETVAHGIAGGQTVQVRPAEQIFTTLDRNSRNRGLWFDRDMVKYCRKSYAVLRRVDRIIDDATGQMRTMKTPCIVLDGVTGSGEFLHFVAQEEFLFWREAWLAPTRSDRPSDV